MSSQYSQSWARGFSPLFSGPHSDQNLRVSDAERQAVTDRLAEHFGDGRLDQAEFDERVGRAMNAKTRADLSWPLRRPAGNRGSGSNGLPAAPVQAPPPRSGPRALLRSRPHGRPCGLLGRRAIAVARVARGSRLVRDQGRRAYPRRPRPLAAPAASFASRPRGRSSESGPVRASAAPVDHQANIARYRGYP